MNIIECFGEEPTSYFTKTSSFPMVMAAHSVIEGFYCLLIDGCLCRVATLIQRKFADGSITVKVTNKNFLTSG